MISRTMSFKSPSPVELLIGRSKPSLFSLWLELRWNKFEADKEGGKDKTDKQKDREASD